MEKIYKDNIPSQEDIQSQYKEVMNKQDNVEDMIYDGQIIEYFGLFFDDLYEIFKNEHYAPKTLDDANNYLLHNYYNLDSVKYITVVYPKLVDKREQLCAFKIGRASCRERV